MVLLTCVANCCAKTSLLVPNVCRCPVTTLVTRTRRVRPKEDRYDHLTVIWVAGGRWTQEVFPTKTEGVASLADHLCWNSCLLGDSGTKHRTRQWISWNCKAFQVDLLGERRNTWSDHKMFGQDDNWESFSGFPHFFQHFHLKQRKCYTICVPVLLERQETKVGLHDCRLKTYSLYRYMTVRDCEMY